MLGRPRRPLTKVQLLLLPLPREDTSPPRKARPPATSSSALAVAVAMLRMGGEEGVGPASFPEHWRRDDGAVAAARPARPDRRSVAQLAQRDLREFPRSVVVGVRGSLDDGGVVVVEGPSGEDVMAIHPVMYMALSYDHRIVDGVAANGFLWRVNELLTKGEFDVG